MFRMRLLALLFALAVVGFAFLPAKFAFMLAGAGAVVGGISILASNTGGCVALIVGGMLFAALGVRIALRDHREQAERAEATAESIRRKMAGW